MRRKAIPEMLRALEKPVDDYQRGELIRALDCLDDKRITDAFRRLCRGTAQDEATYWCLDYLTRHCDTKSLEIVNAVRTYPIPSHVFADTVRNFGTCRYYEGTGMLIDGLRAASLNIVEACQNSLLDLYPNGPTDITPDEKGQAAWRQFLAAKANPR